MAGKNQFFDDFRKQSDSGLVDNYEFFSGSGQSTPSFVQNEGFASFLADARQDKLNVWWAVIKRNATQGVRMDLLNRKGFEVRIETKIRVSHAPRRVNLHAFTQRATDHHKDLMEFDIPDTDNWHTISYTTSGFHAERGDELFFQLAMMDWGLKKYQVDIQYFKVAAVEAAAGPDKGVQTPYHPPVLPVRTYAHHEKPAENAVISRQFPNMNYGTWGIREGSAWRTLLSVNPDVWTVLRWDLSPYKNKKVNGRGLLELTTHSVLTFSEEIYDFGMMRTVEIIGGAEDWTRAAITWNKFLAEKNIADVFNAQMIIDAYPASGEGAKTWLTISEPVLQRLIDGRTRGLLLRHLGSLNASFHGLDSEDKTKAPLLHFNVK